MNDRQENAATAPGLKHGLTIFGVRISQDHRGKLERLARARGMSFTEIVEKGIDLVDAETRGR